MSDTPTSAPETDAEPFATNSPDDLFMQVEMSQGGMVASAWLEVAGAREGEVIQLGDEEDIWHIDRVFDFTLNRDQLRRLQPMHGSQAETIH